MYQNRYAQRSVRPPRRFNHSAGATRDAEKQKFLPPLYSYLDKRIFIQLKGNSRKISGTFAGFDMFQNVALTSAVDESDVGVKVDVGDIVRFVPESISCSFL
jgi:small nuclear ribonucleoprotein (snRNP)-like protein